LTVQLPQAHFRKFDKLTPLRIRAKYLTGPGQPKPGSRGYLPVFLAALGASLPLSSAFGQGAASDQSGTVTATTDATPKTWYQEKFAGSYTELSTYLGSGTFYRSGYNNPYVSNALYLKPTYKLGTPRELTLNARLFLEWEHSDPDNPEARRFNPLDIWVWLAARNLYTEPSSKIRFGGLVRAIVPVSPESRYSNMLGGAALGASASRPFKLGADKKWDLALTLSTAVTKYLHSRLFRGEPGGESTGCNTIAPPISGSGGIVGGAPSSSEADRCGGPFNTNFGFTTAGIAALSRGNWSFTTTLILINSFKYRVPPDALTPMNAVNVGRADATWGILGLNYSFTERVGAGVGVSSYQPALDSRYRYPRFPFFDFAGPNANNYTTVFVSVNGTL
jgi:hypothetical protein